MILIISTKTAEGTTCEVINWLHFFKSKWQKLNGEELYEDPVLTYKINDRGPDLQLLIDNKTIFISDIKSIWFRRSGIWNNPDFEQVERRGRDTLSKFCMAEINEIKNSFFHAISKKKCLSNPINQRDVNKINILSLAQAVGLNIPNTILCGIKKNLEEFFKENKSIIIKPISNPDFFSIGGDIHMSYTEAVDEEFINQLPDKFIPCLAQQKIEKDIEIRTFVLEDELYSMAIFSQNDQQTQVDFRRYNNEKPNRNVPYKLPEALEKKIKLFMQKAHLTTGSIDLIKSVDGEYIFLEINPIGQFGMVSNPCNYPLERKVAEWLVKNDN